METVESTQQATVGITKNLGLEKIEQDRHRIWETIINGS